MLPTVIINELNVYIRRGEPLICKANYVKPACFRNILLTPTRRIPRSLVQ